MSLLTRFFIIGPDEPDRALGLLGRLHEGLNRHKHLLESIIGFEIQGEEGALESLQPACEVAVAGEGLTHADERPDDVHTLMVMARFDRSTLAGRRHAP